MSTPVPDVSVRTARVNDAPAVGLVQAHVWLDAYRGKLPDEVLDACTGPAFTNAWRRSLTSPPSPAYRLLVSCVGEQVTGYVAVGPGQDPDAEEGDGEILTMGVHPEHRRCGHGSRLLNAAVDTLTVNDLPHVSTWILSSDEASRAFCEAAGFAPDGAHRDRVVSPEGDTLREVRLTATREA